MKKRILILACITTLITCKTPLNVTEIRVHKNISIDEEIGESKAIKDIVIPYKQSMERQMNSKISHTSVELTKQGDNSSLGNLLADYTYEGAMDWARQNNVSQIDAAVINIGGIRSVISKGDILLKHIFEVMPFENEVVIVKMNGMAMQELFSYYKGKKNNPVSHLIIETDGKDLQKILINGQPLDVNKTYHIATSDYLALGGDNMKFFKKGEMISTGIKLRDLFIDKFKQNPEVKVPTDIRLIFN